ncbi:peptidoglycan-binding protein [Pseudomonas sp. CGJS7]|uniref:peptidoglycan-binding protein n=1 Tax=Pseudomonas sp. CGJS7 TaxID=3109348 RepID=UPI00300B1E55
MSNGHGRSTEGFGIDRNSSVNLIVKTALENGVTDPKQIAYMLATAQHETRNFNAPEEDFGRSQARKLGYSGGENYYGRGYVHLTHDYNYEKFDKALGLNGALVKNPDLAKDPELAAKILVIGMRDGMFTGKRLDRYIDADSHDDYNARRVVNGISPSKPWSVKAAKDCEDYAAEWEKKVPALIEGVKKNGVTLQPEAERPRHGTTPAPASRDAMADGVLKLEERGPAVRELQQTLNRLGYRDAEGKPLQVDGHFGGNTKHAVEAFQRANHLDPDGKAGPKTLEALKHAPAVSRDAMADGVLKIDERGPAVRELQQTLNRLGYRDAEGKPLQVDGHFGGNTKHAVEAFQRANHLDQDGKAGPKTLEALKHAQPAHQQGERPQGPLLSDSNHPNHALYKQALDGLEKLGPQAGYANPADRQRAAASMAYEARVGGMTEINRVVVNASGTGVFAVQGDPTNPASQRVMMDKAQAAAVSVEQSTEQLKQDVPAAKAAPTPEREQVKPQMA